MDESTKEGGVYYVQHYIDGTKCDVTGSVLKYFVAKNIEMLLYSY